MLCRIHAHLTALSARHSLIFFCKALFSTLVLPWYRLSRPLLLCMSAALHPKSSAFPTGQRLQASAVGQTLSQNMPATKADRHASATREDKRVSVTLAGHSGLWNWQAWGYLPGGALVSSLRATFVWEAPPNLEAGMCARVCQEAGGSPAHELSSTAGGLLFFHLAWYSSIHGRGSKSMVI